MAAKILALGDTRYEKTLYLGSDTYAVKPEAAEIFDVLDHFDVAVAHAPLRINTELGADPIAEIPRCFPEMNCDVVAFRRSAATLAFMSRWYEMYVDHAFNHPHDQGAFRYLAYHSDLRIAILPPEYNYRGWSYNEKTVILQNRNVLPVYRRVEHGKGLSLKEKLKVHLRTRIEGQF
jgi:hypothetical protein